MNDDMNQNAAYGSDYQPVIDRLREIAARGVRPQQDSQPDPAMLRQNGMAGNEGRQMMSQEAMDFVQQLMSRPDMMGRFVDLMNKEGMAEQLMPASHEKASLPGMPPPQSFPDGSTPYTRLKERINRIGKGQDLSRDNGNGTY